jgi:hypothetical protein
MKALKVIAFFMGAFILGICAYHLISSSFKAEDATFLEHTTFATFGGGNDERSTKFQEIESSEFACGLEAHNPNSTFDKVPIDWELLGLSAVPTSDDFGGKEVYTSGKATNGLRHCFSPDETGAVFAAINYFMCSQDEFCLKDLYRHAVYPKVTDDTEIPEAKTSMKVILSAYKVNVIDDGKVRVSILYRSASGIGAIFTSTYVWADGDWKMFLYADGLPHPGVTVAKRFHNYYIDDDFISIDDYEYKRWRLYE